jgi:hypothetical protein
MMNQHKAVNIAPPLAIMMISRDEKRKLKTRVESTRREERHTEVTTSNAGAWSHCDGIEYYHHPFDRPMPWQ